MPGLWLPLCSLTAQRPKRREFSTPLQPKNAAAPTHKTQTRHWLPSASKSARRISFASRKLGSSGMSSDSPRSCRPWMMK